MPLSSAKLHPPLAFPLSGGINSCRMWRVQAHTIVVFFPHGAYRRELVSSQAARAT
jgi:hypothetical protein